MIQIADKKEFYRLSSNLLLGNRLKQWTASEFIDLWHSPDYGNLPEIIGIRHLNPWGGKSFRTSRFKAYEYLSGSLLEGESVLLDEAAHDPWITLQGEIMADYEGLYIRYSTRQCHQRELWASGEYEHAQRLLASAILQKYMDADSWEECNRILREYEYPVIEFTCFDRPVGVLSWNTLFWEIRTNY